MKLFNPGVRVRATQQILNASGELAGAKDIVIAEGTIGTVITKRECKKNQNASRVVVQFKHNDHNSEVLVSCTLDMITPAEP